MFNAHAFLYVCMYVCMCEVMCEVLANATFGCIERLLSQHSGVLAAERGIPDDIARLHVPLDMYDPDSWTAWTHDCARAPS